MSEEHPSPEVDPQGGAVGEPEPGSTPEPEAAVVDEVVEPELLPDPAELARQALEKQLCETEGRLRAVSAAYRNLQDELRAFRERTERLREEEDRRRRGEAVAAVFEPVMNLRRSLEALSGLAAHEEVLGGLRLVLDQFLAALAKLGLEEIPAVGQPFDPNVHEAMGTVPVGDPAADNVVLHLFDAGYRIGRQVIQPARVVIGVYQAPAGET